MDLKWLDDLVALAEEGSLSRAASRRNTTQPAFSRRIQAIEDWLGSKVLDRSSKPARISTAITRHIEDIRSMSRDVKRLRTDVQNWEQSHRQVVIATQHTLSITLFPGFVHAFNQAYPQSAIQLRSANWDECFSLLMTGQAAVLVAYEMDDFDATVDAALIECKQLRADRLVPVVARQHFERLLQREVENALLYIIGYPEDVLFGKIFQSRILSKLPPQRQLVTVCTTALVPAVVEIAREGAGIAWVPESILLRSNADGCLVVVDDVLPFHSLTVSAMRLLTPRSLTSESVWNELLRFSKLDAV